MACYLSSETTLEGTSSSSAMSSAIQKPSALVENASPMLTVVETFMSSRKVGGFVIASQTLIPGGPAITISSSPISLPTSAADLTVGGTAYVFVSTTQHAMLNPPPLTIGGSVITPSTGSNYLIGSQTLMPGGLAITISGTLIYLAPSASEVVIGSTTHKLASAVGRVQPPLPTLTMEGSAVTPNSAGAYIIASQKLTPGGPAITVSGTLISLAPSLSDVVIGGTTQVIVSAAEGAQPLLPTLTMEDSAVTPNSAGDNIITSQTLIPGGTAITVSAIPISLAPAASDLVIGTSTEMLAAPTETAKLGGYIISALGGVPAGASTSTVVFQGEGVSPGSCSLWRVFMAAVTGLAMCSLTF